VVTQKYVQLDYVVDWIRNPPKKITMCSIIWKVVINSFAMVRDGLSGHIGNGKKFHIGVDPCLGSEDKHILRLDLIVILHDQGLFHLT